MAARACKNNIATSIMLGLVRLVDLGALLVTGADLDAIQDS